MNLHTFFVAWAKILAALGMVSVVLTLFWATLLVIRGIWWR